MQTSAVQQRGVGEARGSPGHGFVVLSVYPLHQRPVTLETDNVMDQTCSVNQSSPDARCLLNPDDMPSASLIMIASWKEAIVLLSIA